MENLQRKGFKPMFVGDGVNDAAAVSKAFLGVAMGGGSDITKVAGDVVFVNENLKNIEILMKIGKEVKKKSVENLAWVFIYNLTLVPIATGILRSVGVTLRPEIAALAMIASDISVVLNSLTLLRYRAV